MRFIIDQMFPRDLAEFFKGHGHEAATARRLGLKGGADEAIWEHAAETDSVVVTHDSDFIALMQKTTRGQLLHYRGGNRTSAELISVFEANLPAIIAALQEGERYIEFG